MYNTRYKFSIERNEDKTYLVCRALFNYKGKDLEAVHSFPVIDGTREKDITKEEQYRVIEEVNKAITKFKLNN